MPKRRTSRRAEKRANLENPSIPLTGYGILERVSGNQTPFGPISSDTALSFSAVYAAIRIISEAIAALPLLLEQLTSSGHRQATEHPLYSLLADSPNDLMSSFVWRETTMFAVLLKGNSYCYIERNGAGSPVALLPLCPDDLKVGVVNGQKVYAYQLNATSPPELLTDSDILHIPGLSYDGLTGLSPIQYARNSIGAGLAAERHAAQFFAQGTATAGVLEIPQKLSDPAYKRLRESWENTYSGIRGAHKVAILEEGAKFTSTQMSAEDAQFIQTRKFQLNEVARWYRVPPHMLGDLDRATFSNIEHQGIEFVTYTLTPWLRKLEQEYWRKLLSPAEQGSYRFRFNADELQRGDFKTRLEAYNIAINCGILSPDEARALEHLNARTDGLGGEYLRPMNMATATDADEAAEAAEPPESPAVEQQEQQQAQGEADPEGEPEGGAARSLAPEAVLKAMSLPLADSLRRMAHKEFEATRKPEKRAEFYSRHPATLASAILPSLRSLALLLGRGPVEAEQYASTYASDYCLDAQTKEPQEASEERAGTEAERIVAQFQGNQK